MSDAPAGFEPAMSGDWSILAVPDLCEDARAFLRERSADDLASPGAKPGEGRGGTVEMQTADGRLLVIKVLRKGGLAAKARGDFHGRARLVAELKVLAEAARRGIPTARPAFGATARMRDGRLAAALATEKLHGAATLASILARRAVREEIFERRRLLARAGEAVRAAHDRGLDHSDLNAGNILVSLDSPAPSGSSPTVPPSPGAWVIDLGTSKLGRPLPAPARAANLVRLLRFVEKHQGRDARRLRDAMAFLGGYVGRSGGEARRTFRADLLRAIKRRLPVMALHRIGWSLTHRGAKSRSRKR